MLEMLPLPLLHAAILIAFAFYALLASGFDAFTRPTERYGFGRDGGSISSSFGT